jgi:hypothetical protein
MSGTWSALLHCFFVALSGKAEGRRQKAEGNSDSCPLLVTEGNKGLSPPPNFQFGGLNLGGV